MKTVEKRARQMLRDALLKDAAPTLLKAARKAVAEYMKLPTGPGCVILPAMDDLQEAIAKAEGRVPA